MEVLRRRILPDRALRNRAGAIWSWIAASAFLLPTSPLFAPPPLPTAASTQIDAAANVNPPPTRGESAGATHTAPTMEAIASVLRRLPSIDASTDDSLRKLPQVEPGMLPPHTKLSRIDSGTDQTAEDDEMYLLPPVSAAETTPNATGADQQPDALDAHRLPATTLADPVIETAPADPSTLRHLPAVPLEAPVPPPAPQRLPAVTPDIPGDHAALDHPPELDSAALTRLDDHVHRLARGAADLASRGACFSARAEMLQTLRSITQTLDANQMTHAHSDALGRAMRALDEAEDFSPRGSHVEADFNLSQFVTVHKTPVLKSEDLARVAPVVAQQRYLQYAREQLTVACESVPAASESLYVLARIYTLLEDATRETPTLCLPTAVVLYQAALTVDPQNGRAANELGVLLTGCGRLEEARCALLHSVAVQPNPTAWHNLSVLHQRLGQTELACRASLQSEALAAQDHQTRPAPIQSVQWVDLQTFSTVSSASVR